jgi:hypothetical protein
MIQKIKHILSLIVAILSTFLSLKVLVNNFAVLPSVILNINLMYVIVYIAPLLMGPVSLVFCILYIKTKKELYFWLSILIPISIFLTTTNLGVIFNFFGHPFVN